MKRQAIQWCSGKETVQEILKEKQHEEVVVYFTEGDKVSRQGEASGCGIVDGCVAETQIEKVPITVLSWSENQELAAKACILGTE